MQIDINHVNKLLVPAISKALHAADIVSSLPANSPTRLGVESLVTRDFNSRLSVLARHYPAFVNPETRLLVDDLCKRALADALNADSLFRIVSQAMIWSNETNNPPTVAKRGTVGVTLLVQMAYSSLSPLILKFNNWPTQVEADKEYQRLGEV